MAERTLAFRPGPRPGTVLSEQGEVLAIPAGWGCLLPGDAAATRRVKAAGPAWLVQERRGRKLFSRGLYAPVETIERILAELAIERSTPAYARKQATAKASRAIAQERYVDEFEEAVLRFLSFPERYSALAKKLAKAVVELATPVGSGTVARTQRISLEDRAEAAVIAWMRHQTTRYDSMRIARVKGERREVRRKLARRSHQLLQRYRDDRDPLLNCPLQRALTELPSQSNPTDG